MGVPKFYRWISERYPKINQVITDSALLPEFDHLYLDMNGIIHGCTHPAHLDVSDVLSEKDMMLGIMHYLDRIITQIVKPQVSVFMAIDGVAPRAKLNQQRSRRFRSAKDLAEATKDRHIPSPGGDDGSGGSPYSGAFDSNCITPGTDFMARVSATIKYFIRKKIKEDPSWRKLKIIFSGHEIPGEGEHKIMEHIRLMRNQPGYQPNTRHCMYGQDADLIMLGLVSHEPHFTLLREIVDFGGGFDQNANALKTVKKFTKQSDFQLLHLSVLREYLQIEFAYGLDPDSYNLESIIDDFVFMTFLVGNDFLPHMPTLDIGDGAFDLLFDTYKAQRPGWGEGNYLTHAGEIADAARLEEFIAVIGAAETEILERREENEAAYLKKKRRWDRRDGRPEGPSDAQLAAREESRQLDYLTMIEDMVRKHSVDGKFIDGWTPPTDTNKKDFKGRYYFEKLYFTPVDVDDHMALRKSYIEGLMWCLAYYYRGCISWGWFYPYHYGPMLSDLTNLPQVFAEIKFDLGAPLKPFEQLMGCLPPASSALVPRPYRKLMCSPNSPIIQFYPETFEVDMNGKRNPWEGVNILPFIDVNLLKDTITEYCPDKVLTADERSRNRIGKVYCYTFDAAVNDTVLSCNRDIGLSDITKCNSRVDILEEPSVGDVSFKPELMPGTQIPYPGFPSLNVLPIASVQLIPIGLNCFGMPSKYPNTILTLHKMPQLPAAKELAENILGKSLFVNWPMMHEGKVVSVSDATCEVRTVKKKKKVKKFTNAEAERWESDSVLMGQHYLNGSGVPGSGGVDIGNIQIRLKLVPLQGMKTSPVNGSTKKLFGKEEADVPLQMALWKAPAPDPRFIERGPITLEDRFPAESRVLLTKGRHRGCLGTVLGVVDGDKVGVKVQVIPPEPPFGLAIARSVQESFISSAEAAKVLQINPRIFGQIVGNLFFEPGRYDLGLNLKYRENLCVLGYARKKPTASNGSAKKSGHKNSAWKAGDSVLVVGSKRSSGGDEEEVGRTIWEYTPKAVRLVAAYKQKFPQLFAALAKYPNEKKYSARALLGPKGEEMLPKVRDWLNNIETAKIPRMPSSTEAMSFSAIAAVQRAADVRVAAREKEAPLKEANIKIPPSALYREGSTNATDVMIGSSLNENAAPELGDRIANLCANGVPFGARGTVVSIHDPAEGCVEVVMDEEFIGGSTLQGSCASFRGKLCVWNHLLKISAADSQGVVDQMIPAGSVKAAIDSAVESNGHQKQRPATPRHISSSYETAVVSYATATQKKQSGQRADISGSSPGPQRAMTPMRSNVGKTKGGPASSGRGGKQGFWREARGPDDKGIGFRWAERGVKSGIQAWRSLVASNGPTGTRQEVTRKDDGESGSASAGLKALLGVKSESSADAPTERKDVSSGLKAMLGVGASTATATDLDNVPLPPPPPPAPRPATAADAFFEMMMSEEPTSTPPAIPIQQPQGSNFNFTYVNEGEEPPPLSQEQGTPHTPYDTGMVPGPTMIPMQVHPGTMQAPMLHGPLPSGFSVLQPTAVQSSASVVKRERKVKKSNASNDIVPSVVATKGKK